MRILKQSVAANVMIFLTSEIDHITGIAGVTPVITLSKNGGAFAGISPVVSDRGNGWYNIQLTTSHTDTVGDLALHITGTGADPADLVMYVMTKVPQDIFDLVDELHQLEGLKQGSPMVVTPTSRAVGSITLAISGDGETSTTVTRQ